MTTQQIEPGFALALAGQVAVGLTPGEGAAERMHGALHAIGAMLLDATDFDMVRETLGLVDELVVTQHGEGVTRMERRP